MIAATRQKPHRRRRAGFTLIEMLLSLTIVSVITVACGSVIALAARSVAGSADTSTTSRSAALRRAADQISSELATALVVSASTANSITFTVPPRNGDLLPETISYAWAGAGQPITRQYNGGVAVSIADNVQNFNLSYLTKLSAAPPPVESAEQLLASYVGAANGWTDMTTSSWECQYFNPTAMMPGNTASAQPASFPYISRGIDTGSMSSDESVCPRISV